MMYLLQHILERTAARSPAATAFRYLSDSLSYQELDSMSDKLAGCLADRGIQRGDRVGIYLNKSLECAVAIYGILKSGAAYVPLDPGAPAARLGLILRDCGIRCLVTHDPKKTQVEALLALPDHPLETIIGLSESVHDGLGQYSWDEVREIHAHRPDYASRTANDAAYVIYTSGSTGTPKGIVHDHSSGLSYALMAAELYGLSSSDRLSNLPPLHFDQSIFDYFSGVAVGACTVIIPEAYAKLPASLSELIQRERLTIWYSVPYALIQLLLHGVLHERDLSSLRHVLFGGEPFPSKYLARLMALCPQAQFCNVYGPAEVNQCTFYFLPQPWKEAMQPAPIGGACPNVELLVVDEDDNQVENEEPGELLVRTPTAMRGYFGRPDLVDSAFYRRKNDDGTVDSFYRSGDLVVLRADGNLDFIGRKDRQVKVRGFRIELDEIEAVIATHPAIEEAAATIKGSQGESVAIEVYVTLASEQDCSSEALRRFATQRLPQHAIPETINIMPEFPRTTTGKIDRSKLHKEPEAQLSERNLAV